MEKRDSTTVTNDKEEFVEPFESADDLNRSISEKLMLSKHKNITTPKKNEDIEITKGKDELRKVAEQDKKNCCCLII